MRRRSNDREHPRNECNAVAGVCKHISGQSCSIDVGCADPTMPTARVACSGSHTNIGVSTTTMTCHRVDEPDSGGCGYCVDQTDCEGDTTCYGGICVADSGAQFFNTAFCCAYGALCSNTGALSTCTCK